MSALHSTETGFYYLITNAARQKLLNKLGALVKRKQISGYAYSELHHFGIVEFKEQHRHFQAMYILTDKFKITSKFIISAQKAHVAKELLERISSHVGSVGAGSLELSREETTKTMQCNKRLARSLEKLVTPRKIIKNKKGRLIK